MSYELRSARFLARDVLARAVRPGDAVIDATMGNGHDTLFLSEMVGKTGKVYAFDIQPEALASTERLLEDYGIADRAHPSGCAFSNEDRGLGAPGFHTVKTLRSFSRRCSRTGGRPRGCGPSRAGRA